MSEALLRRVRFDLIRYANCWEDPELLVAALQPAGKRLLSVASGGDNSLVLAGEGATEVVAADLSRAQLACLALKCVAIRELDDPALYAFLGLTPSADRLAVFDVSLRRHLTADVAEFWTARRQALAAGVIHAGKFENYFRLFRRWALPLVHGRRAVADLLRERDESQRCVFYRERWNTWRWRAVFHIFFSRWMMGRLGRDPEFFRQVEGAVAQRILQRVEYALTVLPTHTNPYLEYILTGTFSAATPPPYLEPARLARIRENLVAVKLFTGPIERAKGDFDGFNLSDIFEYLPPESVTAVYGALLRKARPGARFAYWNMLAPRSRPEAYRDRVVECTELAERLFARDRAFFYRRFVVEEVRA